jgi:c-di-GMP-binding flagellar brake protein YcgR
MLDAIAELSQTLAKAEFSPYTVTDPVEIAGILTGMRSRQARANVYFNAQPGSILTTILDVNGAARTFKFDIDTDQRRNQALAGAQRLAWQTSIEGVKIEFSTEAARFTQFDGAPAFETTLPNRVLRLQRRNAYRAPTPIARPVMCLIDADGTGVSEAKARVLDISALGLSLLIDTSQLPVSALMNLARLTVELPGFGQVQCSAEIRYAIDPGRRMPSHYRRCGVQFKELAAADQVLIQRYINVLERERAKSKAHG